MRNTSKVSASRGGAKVVELRRPPDTRDRVLVVAQALFAERGYRGTSLRDIAKRIGIKAPSLLHHFPSKQQLYLAVLEKMFESLEDAANAIAWGKGSRQDRMRQAVGNAIDFIASHSERRLPPLFSTAVNFIFRGQREGEFRSEVDPLHFMWSLNSITIGYFTTAAMLRRLWNMNLLEPAMIERRKREVIDMVERTLFTTTGQKAD